MSILSYNKISGKRISTLICLMGLIILSAACSKFVDVGRPQEKLLTEEVFSSDETALSGMYGIYSFIGRGSSSGILVMSNRFGGMSADELTRIVSWDLDDQFETNSLLATNGRVRFLWTNAYKAIYYFNSMLEGLERSTAVSKKVKQQLLGECYFLRAYHYYMLVNFYGNVPLITGTDYNVNLMMPRTPVSEVYAKVVEDLEKAGELLETAYPVADRIRPNRFAAMALLARVNLYINKPEEAERLATLLIDEPMYKLEQDLNGVFLVKSREAIWQISYGDNNTYETFDGNTYILEGNAYKDYALSPHLLDAFEAGDKRKEKWVGKIDIDGKDYYYVYKYKVRQKAAAAAYTEYHTPFRLGEQYLIRAEARAILKNIKGAIKDVNLIRDRADLLPLPEDITQSECLKHIMQERRIEMMMEFAHRWFDLKRTGQVDVVMSAVKGATWQPTDALYPIHEQDLVTAPNLLPNPGYE